MNVKKLFYKIATAPKHTIYHPDYRDKVVHVTTLNGVTYYRFKDELDMPYGRYTFLAAFLQAIELRMDLKTLNGYIELIEKYLSGGKGVVDIGKALITLMQLKTRTKILFDVDLAYNLASCIYFTDSEPLNTYSIELNKKKIAAWREANALDFFMLTPVKELLGLRNLSITDLMIYLEKNQPIVEELNSAMQQALRNEQLIQ